LPDSKFAVSISKKVSSKAVDRNRLRRQINEALREHKSAMKEAIVCLIIQKKGSPEVLEYNIIDAEIQEFINHL